LTFVKSPTGDSVQMDPPIDQLLFDTELMNSFYRQNKHFISSFMSKRAASDSSSSSYAAAHVAASDSKKRRVNVASTITKKLKQKKSSAASVNNSVSKTLKITNTVAAAAVVETRSEGELRVSFKYIEGSSSAVRRQVTIHQLL
jgi:hypothetical protein